MYFAVIFSTQPENTTACRGSNVTISCGYVTNSELPVTWIINGTPFDVETLENSPLYQLNNAEDPLFYSLTVFSIDGTTTFQCIIELPTRGNIISTPGKVTVIGTYVHT